MDRTEVYRAIDAERGYQDKWHPEIAGVLPGEAKDKLPLNLPLPPSDELRLIRAYLHQADMAWMRDPDDQTTGVKVNPSDLLVIRKIAAVAVRCMENHGIVDRGSVTIRREPLPADPADDALLQTLGEVNRMVKEGIAKQQRVSVRISCPGAIDSDFSEGINKGKHTLRMAYSINISIG